MNASSTVAMVCLLLVAAPAFAQAPAVSEPGPEPLEVEAPQQPPLRLSLHLGTLSLGLSLELRLAPRDGLVAELGGGFHLGAGFNPGGPAAGRLNFAYELLHAGVAWRHSSRDGRGRVDSGLQLAWQGLATTDGGFAGKFVSAYVQPSVGRGRVRFGSKLAGGVLMGAGRNTFALVILPVLVIVDL